MRFTISYWRDSYQIKQVYPKRCFSIIETNFQRTPANKWKALIPCFQHFNQTDSDIHEKSSGGTFYKSVSGAKQSSNPEKSIT